MLYDTFTSRWRGPNFLLSKLYQARNRKAVWLGRPPLCPFRSLTQLCPTLWDPMDGSPPGSSVHGILQARILEWVAISFCMGSSSPRGWTQVSCNASWFLTLWATREPHQCSEADSKYPHNLMEWKKLQFRETEVSFICRTIYQRVGMYLEKYEIGSSFYEARIALYQY